MTLRPLLGSGDLHGHTKSVGAIELLACGAGDAAENLAELAANGSRGAVHLVNAYTIALAYKTPSYHRLFEWPAINFPDGKPLTWISALSGHAPRLRQVRGPQLFLDVFEIGQRRGLKHYLLGSTPEVLASLKSRLNAQFPDALIVGNESPPFRELTPAEQQAQDARIEASGADIVWVGLGTPKQDAEVDRIARSVPVLAVAVGAAFDFAAGTQPEAPTWMRSAGLEWLFRFSMEPRRLWKRYLFGNVIFLRAAMRRPRSEAADREESRAQGRR